MYRRSRATRFVMMIPLFILGFGLFTLLIMLLWNAVLPGVLGVKSITFWQALGIFALSKLLFGFNMGGRRRYGRMREKFANMTPEEKEKFRAEWKDRCRSWGRQDDIPSSFSE